MSERKKRWTAALLAALAAALAVYGVMQHIQTAQEEKQLSIAISGYTAAGEALLDAVRADTANEGEYAWRYCQLLRAAGAVEARQDTTIGMRFREDRYDQGRIFVLTVIDIPNTTFPASLEEALQDEESLAMLEEYIRLLSDANDVLRAEGMKAFLTGLSESEDVAAWLAALSA